MTSFTPGPWKASYDRVERRHSFVGDGMWFAKVYWTVISDRNEADARLIAAAPDLLQALKAAKEVVDIAEHMTSSRSDDDFVWSAQKLINAAIAKAEGQS